MLNSGPSDVGLSKQQIHAHQGDFADGREYFRRRISVGVTVQHLAPCVTRFWALRRRRTMGVLFVLSRRRTMGVPIILIVLICAMLASPGFAAAPDFRVHELEREVRELRDVLRNQARRLDALEQRAERGRPPEVQVLPGTGLGDQELPRWVDAGRWRQLEPGMTELEALGVLGRPTTVRAEGSTHVLNYALELGSGTFLAGQIVVRDGRVADIITPHLR
jgi:hypothetical protein